MQIVGKSGRSTGSRPQDVPKSAPAQTPNPPPGDAAPAETSHLKETRDELASIIASATDAIVTVDAQQQITLFNAAAEKMFRCPAPAALGQPLDKFIPDRFRAIHRQHIAAFDSTNVSSRSMGAQRALAARRADGSEFPIEASISQVDVAGKKHFTAIIRDVTERLAADQALREAVARFRTIFDHAGVGIMMIAAQGAILEANHTCEKILGYSDAELRGTPYLQITHPRDVEKTRARTSEIMAGGSKVLEYEKRYVHKAGHRIWARVVFTLASGDSRARAPFIKLIEDITPRKQAEARARRARARHAAVLQKFQRLTDREREVLWLMVDGLPTKNIAAQLGASPKTIDVHRARVMEKMSADSVAQLVQMMMPVRKSLTTRSDPTP